MPFGTRKKGRGMKRKRSIKKRVTFKKKKRGSLKKKRSFKKKGSFKKMVGKVNRLSKHIKVTKRLAQGSLGTHIYRERFVGYSTSSQNLQKTESLNLVDTGSYLRAIEDLKFYDPSVPATLVTEDGGNGIYQRDFFFKSVKVEIEIKNNYRIPCWVEAYIVKPRDNTSITPVTSYAAGLSDQGGVSFTSPLAYPWDSIQLGLLWKSVQSVKRYLNGGDSIYMEYILPSFSYDKSYVDTITEVYLPMYHSCNLLTRMSGALAHDNVTPTDIGTGTSAMNIMRTISYVIEYPAGSNLNDIKLDNTFSTFTNGAVTGNKPAAVSTSYGITV